MAAAAVGGEGDVEAVNEARFAARTAILSVASAATEAVCALRPGRNGGIKWDFIREEVRSFTTDVGRWRQLRNAKPPPCRGGSARFTSELRGSARSARSAMIGGR